MPQSHPSRPTASQLMRGSDSSAPPLTPEEDRRWATLSHFGGIAGCLPSAAIYFIFRDRGPFTAQESREALNFTLPLTVVLVVLFALGYLPAVGWIFSLVAVFLWAIMAITGLVAYAECNKGRPYRYRLNFRFIQ
ncbi:DUF4870 domain-containing protein [Nesterenkonia pannonica]|uniref:DUF4870 domain-containing protein n=1 Tax=Nesterenkonia pannonica TaxID=1548602 RepID=UPI002164C739|nr:DUF4870 domain-containing protein [Nesterenkonia pannonica]